MKKLLTFLGIFLIAGVVYFYGCEEELTDPLVGPTGLGVTATGSDSLSLKLTWDASITEDIDGYIAYFDNTPFDTVTATTTSCNHTPASLGDYHVTAYRDDDEEASNTVSTKLEEHSNEGPVYIVPSPLGPSGYGWASNGTGATYSLGTVGNRENIDKVDFVFDSDTTLTDPNTFDTDFEHETGIAYNDTWTYGNLTEAPATGYITYKEVVDGGTYVLWVHGKYYVKMEVTLGTEGGWSKTTFKYGFQKIPGFRRLG